MNKPLNSSQIEVLEIRLKNFMLLIVIALLGGNVYSQIRSSDLRNERGGTYEYSKGPAYYNDSLLTGGAEEYYSDTVLWSKTSYVNGEPSGYEISERIEIGEQP